MAGGMARTAPPTIPGRVGTPDGTMDKRLRILIVDDSERDAVLLARALKHGGLSCYTRRVADAGSMDRALADGAWDAALSDFQIPGFGAGDALALWKSHQGDAPFIVISGAVRDEDAVTLLKAGAHDFVRKDNLARLVPAVERELREGHERHHRQRAEQALKDSQARYRRLFQAAEIAICDQDLSVLWEALQSARRRNMEDPAGVLVGEAGLAGEMVERIRVNDANSAALRLLEADSTAELQASLGWIFGARAVSALTDLLRAMWQGQDVFRADVSLYTLKTGRHLSVILSMPIPSVAEEFASVPVSLLDITDRLQAERQLRESEARLNFLAHHDVLTGLPNRLLFQDRLEHAMQRARRARRQVALLFLDLDRFKHVNDSLGHEVGDALLQEVAIRLRSCIRQSDTVARLGGDEFVIILEEVSDAQEVVTVVEKLRDGLSTPVTVGGHELAVSTSIGISLFPRDSERVDGLMRCADMAMYRCKQRGSHGYQFYTPDLGASAMHRLRTEAELRKAVERRQLLLHYQPQYALDEGAGRPVGVEALVRWQHPERGLVQPGEFVPLAEETGLIVPIGEWVLETACAQNKRWQELGYPPMVVAVNISARQFHERSLVETVTRTLERTGLEPRYLELELTETLVMEDAAGAVATLEALNRMGVHIAIDDFGTGFSSLSYLKRFPINKLKIDQSFVRDCTTDPIDASIIASIIALAHSMSLEAIAEGVEDRRQSMILRHQGCDQAQGFLYARPLPAEDIAALLAGQTRPRRRRSKPGR